MSTKVAINGLGRIGRAVLKLAIDELSMEIVSVNDLTISTHRRQLLRAWGTLHPLRGTACQRGLEWRAPRLPLASRVFRCEDGRSGRASRL